MARTEAQGTDGDEDEDEIEVEATDEDDDQAAQVTPASSQKDDKDSPLPA